MGQRYACKLFWCLTLFATISQSVKAFILDELKCLPEPALTGYDDCVRVGTYEELRRAISLNKRKVVLCSGTLIVKESTDEPIVLDRGFSLLCETNGGCEINGAGTHIEVQKAGVKLIQGIKFRGATKTSVIVRGGARAGTTICQCDFEGNESKRNASIRSSVGAIMKVTHTTFAHNEAKTGSCIFNAGYLEATHLLIEENKGAPIINFGTLFIKDSLFQYNSRHNKRGASAIQNYLYYKIRLKNNTFSSNQGTAIVNKHERSHKDSNDIEETDDELKFMDLGGNYNIFTRGRCPSIRSSINGCFDFIDGTATNANGQISSLS